MPTVLSRSPKEADPTEEPGLGSLQSLMPCGEGRAQPVSTVEELHVTSRGLG